MYVKPLSYAILSVCKIVVMHICTICLAEEDFISGQYNVTVLANATEATANISLQIDDIDEETEHFLLYLYIPSASYELGIQQGDIIKSVAIIFRPGILSK